MKKIIIIIIVIIVITGLWWAWVESNKPLPGESALQEGRNHVSDEGTKIDYKFNPPTSGDHYPSWIKAGFYDEPRADGNLVHSLEHGYIVLWYDCEEKVTSGVILSPRDEGSLSLSQILLKQVERFFASLRMTEVFAQIQMTAGSEGSTSAKLADMPKSFSDGNCDGLKGELRYIYNTFGPHKLIIMPRVRMDHRVIMTAWGRMMKLDSAAEPEREKIKAFINAFRDHGPEQTDEP